MRLVSLAWRNVCGNAFRSLAILLSAALVAAMALSATVVVLGAQVSIRQSLQQLGADILVLPWGTVTDRIGGIRLMSAAVEGWLPRSHLERIGTLDGVAGVSPQWHLATLDGSEYGAGTDLHLVAYEPETDFTLRPWLGGELAAGLPHGAAVVGADIAAPEDDGVLHFYGERVTIAERLQPTGTTIDYSVFVTFDTAEHLVQRAEAQGLVGPHLLPGSVSAIMVRVALGSTPREVAVRILDHVPGAVPLEAPNLYQTQRRQMAGVLRTLLGLLAVVWALTMAFVGLVFSIAVSERRWEIGVLRALGLSQSWVLRALLAEGAVLALAGGLAGSMATTAGLLMLQARTTQVMGLLMYVPSAPGLALLTMGGQAAALGSVTLAALLPAWRISREDVALAMRS